MWNRSWRNMKYTRKKWISRNYASSKTTTKVSVFLKSSITKWLLVLISLQAVKMHYSVSLSCENKREALPLSLSLFLYYYYYLDHQFCLSAIIYIWKNTNIIIINIIHLKIWFKTGHHLPTGCRPRPSP